MKKVYVMTVHWHAEEWIDLQLDYLSRFLDGDYETYAYLNGIDQSHYSKFDHAYDDDIVSHPHKLNLLAEDVLKVANDDDILLFIDGDAFPVNNLSAVIAELDNYPLIAVKREENNGDQQPHPCFCLTTVKFWRDIEGDWYPGTKWRDSLGRMISDVGGKLLGKLDEENIEWKPLIRSNAKDLHPLWFGIYGDVVYHHGAGFRDKLCRLDAMNGVDRFSRMYLRFLKAAKLGQRNQKLNQRLTKWIHDYMRAKNHKLGETIMQSIRTDKEFYNRFR